MSSKDSLKRMRQYPFAGTSPDSYNWSMNQYMQPYREWGSQQQAWGEAARQQSLDKSWAKFQKKRPILTAFLIKMFGKYAKEMHVKLKYDISEDRAADLLTAIEEFDIDNYARLQR